MLPVDELMWLLGKIKSYPRLPKSESTLSRTYNYECKHDFFCAYDLQFWLNLHTYIITIVVIFVLLELKFTYASAVVLLILLKVDMDASAIYPMIGKQYHQASIRRTLQPLRIFHESANVVSTDHYPVHNSLQEQEITRTFTEPA